jgi:glycosyltransferase involved in cell wall biosynthesis
MALNGLHARDHGWEVPAGFAVREKGAEAQRRRQRNGDTAGYAGLHARLLRVAVEPLLKAACRGANTRVLLQSEADRESLLRRRLVRDANIHVVAGGSGVDVERFCPVADGRASPPTIVFASRLLLDKGVREFIEAAAIAQSRGVACRFVVAGEPDLGNPRSVTREQLHDWSRRSPVELLGHHADMPDLLARATAVVLPTAYGEGVPRILVEAASCGTPIICSNHPGCRAVVDDGVNGYTLPTISPESIADAVIRLLREPDAVTRLGAAGRRKAVEQLDGRDVLRQTLELYQTKRAHA